MRVQVALDRIAQLGVSTEVPFSGGAVQRWSISSGLRRLVPGEPADHETLLEFPVRPDGYCIQRGEFRRLSTPQAANCRIQLGGGAWSTTARSSATCCAPPRPRRRRNNATSPSAATSRRRSRCANPAAMAAPVPWQQQLGGDAAGQPGPGPGGRQEPGRVRAALAARYRHAGRLAGAPDRIVRRGATWRELDAGGPGRQRPDRLDPRRAASPVWPHAHRRRADRGSHRADLHAVPGREVQLDGAIDRSTRFPVGRLTP